MRSEKKRLPSTNRKSSKDRADLARLRMDKLSLPSLRNAPGAVPGLCGLICSVSTALNSVVRTGSTQQAADAPPTWAVGGLSRSRRVVSVPAMRDAGRTPGPLFHPGGRARRRVAGTLADIQARSASRPASPHAWNRSRPPPPADDTSRLSSVDDGTCPNRNSSGYTDSSIAMDEPRRAGPKTDSGSCLFRRTSWRNLT